MCLAVEELEIHSRPCDIFLNAGIMSKSANVKAIVEIVQKLYPKQLADGKWDNTGLLVDAMAEDVKPTPSHAKVLLTIDLTASVCKEAIEQNTDLIIAYHPFIFRGIKAVSGDNPQHRSLVKLLREGISVYSPHTAIDASLNGVNDWLADGITEYGKNISSKTTIEPVSPSVKGQEGAGYGRLVKLKTPVSLDQLVKRVKGHLWMSTVQLIQAERHATQPIESVAICAGSGGSVLSGVSADLWFTGELGHHEMLFLRESGTSAIVCGHSNTERGFLPVLRDQILREMALKEQEVTIKLAETDRDPIQYV